MSGIGDFAATLSVSSADWRNGFSDANAVLDRFAANFDTRMAGIVQRSESIAVTARTSALALGALGVGLKIVGGSGGGLLKVAATLSGISWTISNLNTALKNLRPGTTFVQKLTGSIGAVGAAAGIATLALRGVSLALARMGKDTAKVDTIATSLGRIARAATIAVLGIKAVSLSFAAMRGTVSLSIRTATAGLTAIKTVAMTIPSTIGAVANAMRRVGSAGTGMVRSAAASVGQFAAAAGDSIGAIGQGISQIGMGFAIGGVFGGLATAIGLLVSAGVSMESLGTVSTKVAKIIDDLKARSQRYFQSFMQAIQPLVDAIQNVWLPAIRGSTDEAGGAFGRFFDYVETAWGDWIYNSINILAEFVGNIDVYFQIAQQSIVLWASNSILQVQDFFTNAGTWIVWFGDNWWELLTSAGKLAETVFMNMADNIGTVFAQIWEWVKSGFQGSLELDWRPLTEGFKSTVKEWPKLTETELADSTPELEALYKKLGTRQAEAAKRGLNFKGFGQSPEVPEQAGQFKRAPELKAAFKGSQEAASIMLRGVGGGKTMEQIAQKQLTVQQQTLAAVKVNKPVPLQPLTI